MAEKGMTLETCVKGHMIVSTAEQNYGTLVVGITHEVRNVDALVYRRSDPEWRSSTCTFRATHEYLVRQVEQGQEPTLSDSGLLPTA